MGGRWTDDDGTQERHTDTHTHNRHSASGHCHAPASERTSLYVTEGARLLSCAARAAGPDRRVPDLHADDTRIPLAAAAAASCRPLARGPPLDVCVPAPPARHLQPRRLARPGLPPPPHRLRRRLDGGVPRFRRRAVGAALESPRAPPLLALCRAAGRTLLQARGDRGGGRRRGGGGGGGGRSHGRATVAAAASTGAARLDYAAGRLTAPTRTSV
mmetsp:Transcript_22281/g.69792  ORF Transcript_22281/g.69792 Transcript_22281/m.69792 type:complete len:215 (+) Transcript_22281:249-893(+)